MVDIKYILKTTNKSKRETQETNDRFILGASPNLFRVWIGHGVQSSMGDGHQGTIHVPSYPLTRWPRGDPIATLFLFFRDGLVIERCNRCIRHFNLLTSDNRLS